MRRALAATFFAAVLLTACSSIPGARREIVVLAASSLASVLPQAGAVFEQTHPGTAIRFSFGPSSGLATQIQNGAPVDVFASASERWMDAVASKPGIEDRTIFARNRLIVIVPVQNALGLAKFEDIAWDNVRLVLASEGVPSGDYARSALRRAGIYDAAIANLVSNEFDDQAVVQKVAARAADAGIVYATDTSLSDVPPVKAIPIPDRVNLVTPYSVAIVSGSSQSALAREFIAYLLGPGRSILTKAGFLAPE
ncbi:MAG: molybdate ABC transporter substrate-binding protein [Actinomycetota bacterium]